jgi:hypothetical protein
MPRLTQDQWETIRAEREAGATFIGLANQFGVSHQAIQKRAKAEQWGDGQDVGAAIRRKVAEKVAKMVATDNPKKKAEAISAAADKVVGVVQRHQQEWDAHRTRFGSTTTNFEEGKHAKINAEMLKIRQSGERIAHGLDEAGAAPTLEITWA